MPTPSPALPPTMRAVSIARHGGVEVLDVGPFPTPEAGPDDVLIAVHAASINPRDWMIRAGTYVFRRFLPEKPFVLGSDIAGTVLATGAKARRFAPGDRVFAMIPTRRGFGGYAEIAVAPEECVAAMPRSASFADAAAVPLAGMTALQALRDDARQRPGDRVLVIGASGGVGHYGVQIARALGAASVVGVCSGRNAELVRSLGADRVVDYRAEPFPQALAGEAPFDIVFDAMGVQSPARCAPILAPRGSYVTTVPSPRTAWDSVRSRIWPFGRRARIVLVRSNAADLALLAGWMDDGRLRSVVDQREPLERVAALHQHSRSFRTRGKNVLVVREDVR